MATVRPSIYVGLGGTGIKAISQTKKMFEEAYGENNIPSQIAFAAIDFDLTRDPNLPTSMEDDFMVINNAGNPIDLYKTLKNAGKCPWMFPGNSGYLVPRIIDGARMVRTTGRFLTEMILYNIEQCIANCYTQVTNIQGDSDVNVAGPNTVDIHIAMSLAGGTGCGSFLNVAAMLREKYQDKIKIIGYGVLHGVFRTMDPSGNKTPRVVANAYSAILDLDYLMGATPEKPILMTLNGKETELKQPVYDEFFVVDNETENGKRVDKVLKLCEVIGTCMYVAGGEMGNKIQSVQNNIHWKGGSYNISPKLGWVQGLGACQVVYKGNLLAEIYGIKAAIELIRKLQNNSADMQQKAQDWTEQSGIREDGDEYDMLIDAIYGPEKITKIKGVVLDTKDSIADIKTSVAKEIEKLPNDFPVDKANQARTDHIIAGLKKTIREMVKQESGIADARVFLQSLKSLCEKYKGEMEEERFAKDKGAAALLEKLNKSIKEYEEYTERFFTKKSTKEEYLNGIDREVSQIKRFRVESARRVIARNTFSSILATINELLARIQAINDTLTTLDNTYSSELTLKQNSSESTLVFEYDLSYKERLNMKLNPADVVVTAFTANVDLYDIDLEKLDGAIRSYTAGLNQAQLYRDKLIIDVIKDLPDDDYRKLKKEIAEKSSRLLKLNDRGQISVVNGNKQPTSMLVQNYLISLYNKTGADGISVKSRLEDDKDFLRGIQKEYIVSDFESMKQKIIFYRSDMAIIPYCIDAFDDRTVEREYDTVLRDAMQPGSTGFNPHFDQQIFEEMRKKDFKLKPEMQNEAMFYWVCGSLFGWREVTEDMHIMEKDRNGDPIRCTGKEEVTHPKYIRVKVGKYMYWDENGDPGKDQKWKPIDNTKMRNQAYSYFKTIIFPEIKDVLNKKIADEIASKGKNFYITKIQIMKDNGIHDYINCVVCSNKNSSTVSSEDDEEWKQYLEEWKFIENDLENSLINLNS